MLKRVSVVRVPLRKARQVYRDLQFEHSLPPLAKGNVRRTVPAFPSSNPVRNLRFNTRLDECPNWAAKSFIDANLMELQEADHG